MFCYTDQQYKDIVGLFFFQFKNGDKMKIYVLTISNDGALKVHEASEKTISGTVPALYIRNKVKRARRTKVTPVNEKKSIYKGKKGGTFQVRLSKRTGKPYKWYGKDIKINIH